MNNLLHSRYTVAGFFLIGILLLCWPALYNGYALVYSDTGTYLLSSVTLEPPVDRPIAYSLFIRLLGWKETTWPVLFGQAIIVWLITYRTLKVFFERPVVLHFGIILVLSLLSSLPWYTAQLMPDVFAGVIVLLVFLLFYDTKKKWSLLLYGPLLAGIIIFHYSFLLIGLMTASLLLVANIRRKFLAIKPYLFRYGIFLAAMGSAILFVMTINYLKRDEFRFSFSSNVFLTAKFTDGDILNTYLKDNCGKKDIPFCAYKDTVFGSPMAFLWNPNFPVRQSGKQWEVLNEECEVIVHDVFTTSKYRNMFIREAIRATIAQLQENQIGSGLINYANLKDTPGHVIVSDFQDEVGQYVNARQRTENMEDLTINRYNQWILIISTLIIFGGIAYRPLRRRFGLLLMTCLAGVVFNAFVTAALANVYNRLQARITWLLVFGALIVLVGLIQHLRARRRA